MAIDEVRKRAGLLIAPAFRLRAGVPLAALAWLSVSALTVVAKLGLALCSRRVTLPIPMICGSAYGAKLPKGAAQGYLSMSTGHDLVICPVVLVLILGSALLAAAAIVLALTDAQPAFTFRRSLRAFARIPLRRSASTLALGVLVVLLAMIAVDGNGPPPLAACVALLVIVVFGSFSAALLSLMTARVVLALGERLFVAILFFVQSRRANTERAVAHRRVRIVRRSVGHQSRIHGLRAPPLFAH